MKWEQQLSVFRMGTWMHDQVMSPELMEGAGRVLFANSKTRCAGPAYTPVKDSGECVLSHISIGFSRQTTVPLTHSDLLNRGVFPALQSLRSSN